MNKQEAINWLKFRLERPNSGADIDAFKLSIAALEREMEIEQAGLIQCHRKCILGKDTMYADSTLQNMSKAELIHLLHIAQHNYSVLLEEYDGRMKYYEKELSHLSDEIQFEDDDIRKGN